MKFIGSRGGLHLRLALPFHYTYRETGCCDLCVQRNCLKTVATIEVSFIIAGCHFCCRGSCQLSLIKILYIFLSWMTCVCVIFSAHKPPNVMPKCCDILTCMLDTILAHSSCCMSQLILQCLYWSALCTSTYIYISGFGGLGVMCCL